METSPATARIVCTVYVDRDPSTDPPTPILSHRWSTLTKSERVLSPLPTSQQQQSPLTANLNLPVLLSAHEAKSSRGVSDSATPEQQRVAFVLLQDLIDQYLRGTTPPFRRKQRRAAWSSLKLCMMELMLKLVQFEYYDPDQLNSLVRPLVHDLGRCSAAQSKDDEDDRRAITEEDEEKTPNSSNAHGPTSLFGQLRRTLSLDEDPTSKRSKRHTHTHTLPSLKAHHDIRTSKWWWWWFFGFFFEEKETPLF